MHHRGAEPREGIQLSPPGLTITSFRGNSTNFVRMDRTRSRPHAMMHGAEVWFEIDGARGRRDPMPSPTLIFLSYSTSAECSWITQP